LLYTQKTGTPVYLPLPPEVMTRLRSIPPALSARPFWSGEGKPKSAVADWQRNRAKLFKLSKLDNAFAHRFRDTFAVRLLLKDVPLETVSILLGHSSVKITEKHYAPWVWARQLALEEAVMRTW
jgi:integrase/recombinase XerD